MIRIFARQREKLREEDGQALVFVALVGLVIFLFFAMTMNVAELVNIKIKNQNVADAAALSAAVWQARTMNMMAGANRNMLEFWSLAVPAGVACLGTGMACAGFVCTDFAVDLLPCLACLAISLGFCDVEATLIASAIGTGMTMDMILATVDQNLVDPELQEVVRLNYAFKTKTAGYQLPNDVGLYLHYRVQGNQLLQDYPQNAVDTGDYVLERVGACEMAIALARYANYWWHEKGQPADGVTDAQWDSLVPTIDGWYASGGQCHHQVVLPPDPADNILPMAIRSRDSSWTRQDVDSLLAVTVGTYKAQEPPSALGKGSGPGDCEWSEGDDRFPCTNHRHYAFASAHAYSESVSDFYNTYLAGIPNSELIPYISFQMDWEPRLFPLEENGYFDILGQIQNDGFTEDHDMLLRNVLQWNGMNFFLY
jgi:hypothetical protein